MVSSMMDIQIFYKNIVFWAQARYSHKNLDFKADVILRIFLFLTLF